jgi:hypothetical protein
VVETSVDSQAGNFRELYSYYPTTATSSAFKLGCIQYNYNDANITLRLSRLLHSFSRSNNESLARRLVNSPSCSTGWEIVSSWPIHIRLHRPELLPNLIPLLLVLLLVLEDLFFIVSMLMAVRLLCYNQICILSDKLGGGIGAGVVNGLLVPDSRYFSRWLLPVSG